MRGEDPARMIDAAGACVRGMWEREATRTVPKLRFWAARPTGRPAVTWLLLVSVALAALASSRTPLAAQSALLGDENSWVRVQNVGDRASTVDLTFFDASGRRVATDGCPKVNACPAIRPGSGWSFFQQGYDGLPVGYRGSAVLKSDQPFVGLLARDAFKGGLFQIDGDTLRLGRGTAGMAFPVVQHTDTWVSRISIENTSETRDACVEIRYWAQGQGTIAAIDPPAPGAGCPQGGTRLVPHETLLRDERNLTVPFGFDGSAQVRTYDTATGVRAADQALAGTIDTRERRGPALGSKRGITVDEQRRVVVLPLVERNATTGGVTWNTRFRIMNATPGVPNEVSLRYSGTNASGERIEIDHKVTVVSSITCDQRSTGAGACLPNDKDLPSTFSGSVQLQAVEPIAAIVQRASTQGAFSDYRGFTVVDASRSVVLPVLDKNYGAFGDSGGWNSWFRVVSFDGAPAFVRMVYFSKQFPNGQIREGFSAAGAVTVFQGADGHLPDGWVGSAIVISDQPVIVLVGVENTVFQGDTAMLYNGAAFD